MLSKLNNRAVVFFLYIGAVVFFHMFAVSNVENDNKEVIQEVSENKIDLASMHLKEAIKNFIEYRNESIIYEEDKKNYDLRNDYIYEDLFNQMVLEYKLYFYDSQDDVSFKEI